MQISWSQERTCATVTTVTGAIWCGSYSVLVARCLLPSKNIPSLDEHCCPSRPFFFIPFKRIIKGPFVSVDRLPTTSISILLRHKSELFFRASFKGSDRNRLSDNSPNFLSFSRFIHHRRPQICTQHTGNVFFCKCA